MGPLLRVGSRALVLDGNLVMGVVNASPDSFSDGGEHAGRHEQFRLAERQIGEGADIVDVGGESAITGRPERAAADEIARVVPLVAEIRAAFPETLVSVDAYKPAVVEAAVAAGASIVNDVSGLRHPEVASIAAESGCALVLMHTRAAPKQRRQDPSLYDDVVADVVSFLGDAMERAVSLGMPRESLILDPGPDFAKTPYQTLEVVRHLDAVRALGRPVLLALSRKDFLGALLRRGPRGRDAGTLAAIALTTTAPGHIVRVHDVAAARDVLRVVDALVGRADIPADELLAEDLRREPPG